MLADISETVSSPMDDFRDLRESKTSPDTSAGTPDEIELINALRTEMKNFPSAENGRLRSAVRHFQSTPGSKDASNSLIFAHNTAISYKSVSVQANVI